MLLQALWVRIYTKSVMSWRCSFLGVIHHLQFLQSFCLLFHLYSWILSEGLWWRHHIMTRFSIASHSLGIVQLPISMLIPTYWMECWELSDMHRVMSLGVILLHPLTYPFSVLRGVLICSPPPVTFVKHFPAINAPLQLLSLYFLCWGINFESFTIMLSFEKSMHILDKWHLWDYLFTNVFSRSSNLSSQSLSVSFSEKFLVLKI